MGKPYHPRHAVLWMTCVMGIDWCSTCSGLPTPTKARSAGCRWVS